MEIDRRTVVLAPVCWLLLAAVLVGLDIPVLRPLVVGAYVLTVPGFVAASCLTVEGDATDATTLCALSVVLSLAWLVAATIALTLIGASLVALLVLSTLWIALLSPRVRPVRVDVDRSRRESVALGAIVSAVAGYVATPHLLSARVTLSSHGALHSAITYSVVRGNVPPTHPGLAYEPYTAYYWSYHVLLAGLTETMNVAPVVASLVLNLLSIAGVLLLLVRLCRERIGLTRTEGLVAALVPVWGLATIEPPLRYLLGYEPSGLVAWSNRIDPFLGKFVHISGFPLGVFLFTGMLCFLFRGTYDDGSSRRPWVGFVVAGVLLFHVHTTTALFAFLCLGAVTAAATWSDLRSARRARERSASSFDVRFVPGPGVRSLARSDLRWRPFAAWLLVGVGCLPFFVLLRSTGATDGSIHLFAGGRATLPVPGIGPVALEGPHVQHLANARNVVLPFAVVGPFAALGYLRLRKRRAAETRGVAVVAAVLAALGTVVTLEDANQYKAAYLLLVPVVPLAAVGLYRVFDRAGSIRPLLVAVFVAILLFNPLSVLWVEYVHSPWATDDNYEFEGADVRLSDEAPVDPAAFEWIDEETSDESAILVSEAIYDDLEYQPGGARTVMIASALAERDLYYATYELPEHLVPATADPARKKEAERAFSCDGVGDVSFSDLEGPLYVVVPADSGGGTCDLYRAFVESPRWTLEMSGTQVGVFEYDPPASSTATTPGSRETTSGRR